MEKQSFELTSRMSEIHAVHLIAYTGEGSKLKWFLTLKSRVKKVLRDHPNIDIIHLNDGLMGAACLWLKKYSSRGDGGIFERFKGMLLYVHKDQTNEFYMT